VSGRCAVIYIVSISILITFIARLKKRRNSKALELKIKIGYQGPEGVGIKKSKTA
jgi:hypothetical protein